MRLVQGDERSGRVEVRYLDDWGTICDDNFGLEDAQVVCRMLGLPGAESYDSQLVGTFADRATGTIWLDGLECFGTESSLLECKHNGWGFSNCFHSEDVNVVCERSK